MDAEKYFEELQQELEECLRKDFGAEIMEGIKEPHPLTKAAIDTLLYGECCIRINKKTGDIFNITIPEDMKWTLNGKPLDDAAQTAIELAEENTRLKAAIRKHCKECWAFFRGSDPAQCRICVFWEFKDGEK